MCHFALNVIKMSIFNLIQLNPYNQIQLRAIHKVGIRIWFTYLTRTPVCFESASISIPRPKSLCNLLRCGNPYYRVNSVNWFNQQHIVLSFLMLRCQLRISMMLSFVGVVVAVAVVVVVTRFVSFPFHVCSYESIYKHHIGKHPFQWLLWFGGVSNPSQYFSQSVDIYDTKHPLPSPSPGIKENIGLFLLCIHLHHPVLFLNWQRKPNKKTISRHAFHQ